jgi:hypothetical protein
MGMGGGGAGSSLGAGITFNKCLFFIIFLNPLKNFIFGTAPLYIFYIAILL